MKYMTCLCTAASGRVTLAFLVFPRSHAGPHQNAYARCGRTKLLVEFVTGDLPQWPRFVK